MKKAGFILIVFLSLIVPASAQYVRQDSVPGQHHAPQPYNFWNNVSVGGSFGLQFGDVTFVGISPLLNYHFTSSLIVGAGPIYQYYREVDPLYRINYSSSIYGARIAATYYLPDKLHNVFLSGEYDVVNVPYFDIFSYTYSRTSIGIPLVGIGYRQPIGEKSYFIVSGMWDLSNNPASPYTNPLILTGFDFGL